MPRELPPSRWQLPEPSTADEHGIVGVGADLDPSTLIDAYRSGLFPMNLGDDGPLGWWSPDPRGILEVDNFHASRSLRKSMRGFEIRYDTAFDRVVAACADPSRSGRWITDEIAAAYGSLHRAGWAHSVETWLDDELVGGLYGVAIGSFFAGESMFHKVTDASKAAVFGWVEAMKTCKNPLLDVQWQTDHLASLGVTEVDRTTYLRRLATSIEQPRPEPFRS